MNGFPGQYLITTHDIHSILASGSHQVRPYDPELLYVECRGCGRPVVWEPGKTTTMLQEANINTMHLDAQCMLLADTCPSCQPGMQLINIQVVRLSTTTNEDLKHIEILKGKA